MNDEAGLPPLPLDIALSRGPARAPVFGKLTYSATGLPPGLDIDPETGEIGGRPTAAGRYNVTIQATSAYEPESWRERVALRRFLRHWQLKFRR